MKKAEELLAKRERLEALVAARGGRAYSTVAVSGPGLGDWPDGTPVHVVDAVWFDLGEPGSIIELADGRHDQLAADLSSWPAVVLGLRGYADRTLLGQLVAGREMLSRSYPGHRLLRCLAVSERPTWMDSAYLANGIGVQFSDPEVVYPEGHPRAGNPGRSEFEDAQLLHYFTHSLGGRGWMIQEVPVGDRRLDGLHVPTVELDRPMEHWHHDMDIESAVRDFDVEVIEVKRYLNPDVIGQVIAGAHLLARQSPRHRLISQTVVVSSDDSALHWVCDKLGILVGMVPAPW